VLGLSWG